MARSKNGCLKILVCAGSGSDPAAGSDADADEHPDEVSVAACSPPWRRGMRRLLLSSSLSSFRAAVLYGAESCFLFRAAVLVSLDLCRMRRVHRFRGRVCVILGRSGFNSKRGAGINLRIERFSHWFSSLTLSALNFFFYFRICLRC